MFEKGNFEHHFPGWTVEEIDHEVHVSPRDRFVHELSRFCMCEPHLEMLANDEREVWVHYALEPKK